MWKVQQMKQLLTFTKSILMPLVAYQSLLNMSAPSSSIQSQIGLMVGRDAQP